MYRKTSLSLATARDNEEVFLGEFQSLAVQNIDGECSVRLNHYDAPEIDLKKVRVFKAPVYKLYITNAAQPSKTVDLIIGTGVEFAGQTNVVHVGEDPLIETDTVIKRYYENSLDAGTQAYHYPFDASAVGKDKIYEVVYGSIAFVEDTGSANSFCVPVDYLYDGSQKAIELDDRVTGVQAAYRWTGTAYSIQGATVQGHRGFCLSAKNAGAAAKNVSVIFYVRRIK
jgi:hypothetical protein